MIENLLQLIEPTILLILQEIIRLNFTLHFSIYERILLVCFIEYLDLICCSLSLLLVARDLFAVQLVYIFCNALTATLQVGNVALQFLGRQLVLHVIALGLHFSGRAQNLCG